MDVDGHPNHGISIQDYSYMLRCKETSISIPEERRHLAGNTYPVAVVEMEPKLAVQSCCCSWYLPDIMSYIYLSKKAMVKSMYFNAHVVN